METTQMWKKTKGGKMKSIEQFQELSDYLQEVIDDASQQKAMIDKALLLKTLLLRMARK